MFAQSLTGTLPTMGLLEEGQRYAKKKRYIYTRLLILD